MAWLMVMLVLAILENKRVFACILTMVANYACQNPNKLTCLRMYFDNGIPLLKYMRPVLTMVF